MGKSGKELLEEMQDDRDAFEEKYGIKDYEMLNEAIGAGWDEAKGTIEFDPNAITRAGIGFPSFDNLRTGWENLTRTGDENLAGFNITDTMDVDTKPRYDSAFLGFERGDTTGINTLPEGRSISEQVYDAQRREALANLYAQNVDQGTTGGIKAGWRPNMGWLRTAASFFNPFGDKNPLGAALSYGMSRIKPANTMDALGIVSRGDPDLGKGLSGKVSWAGRAYDKEHGAGAYKQKNIDDWVDKYGGMTYKTANMQKKQEEMYKQSTQGKAEAARVAAVAKAIQRDIARGGTGDRPNTGRNEPGGGRGQSPTGGDIGGTPFYQGGRVGFSKGGIVDLWQELSNL